MRFKTILKEILDNNILLNEINKNTIFYHRSRKNWNEGDVIKSFKGGKDKHWLTRMGGEVELERYRKKFHPNKPSRFDCVYLTVVPKSRFLSKGNLYAVRVKNPNNIHITSSIYIDEIRDKGYSGIIARKYWDPPSKAFSHNPKYLEVLAKEVVVVDKIKEDLLGKGDVIRLDNDIVGITISRSVKDDMDDKEVAEYMDQKYPNVEIINKSDINFHIYGIPAKLKKNTIWKVVHAQPNDSYLNSKSYNPTKNRYVRAWLIPNQGVPADVPKEYENGIPLFGKYVMNQFNFTKIK